MLIPHTNRHTRMNRCWYRFNVLFFIFKELEDDFLPAETDNLKLKFTG